MGEDTASHEISDPRNSFFVLWSLDFQGDTENFGKVASVGETARLTHSQTGRKPLSMGQTHSLS